MEPQRPAPGTSASILHVNPTSRRNVWKWALGAIATLTIGVIAGWLAYPQLHKPTTPSVSTGTTSTPSKSATHADTNETITAKLSLDYTPSLGASTTLQPLTVSMEVPLVLRTQITNSTCINGGQGGPAIGESVLEECLHLSFADKLGSGNSHVNSSHLSLWDGYDWMRRDEYTNNQPIQMFNLTTVAQKQHAWQALTSLTPSTDLQAIFKDLPSLAVDACYCGGGVQKLTYAQSADGNLKGVVFVATISQYGEYNPYVWVMMGGTVGNQPLLLTGSFKASDPTVLQINSLFQQDHQSAQAGQLMAQANDQFKTGKLSAQTLQAFNDVLPILKSIKLSAS